MKQRRSQFLMKQSQRWYGFWLAGLSAAWLVSCSRGPQSAVPEHRVARWHFAGATQLRLQSAAPAVLAALQATNAGPTGERLATNLTRALLRRLGRPDSPAAAASLAPLVLDLLRHESAGEVMSSGWRLTMKLPAERWPAWQQNRGAVGALVGATNDLLLTYTNGWLTAGAGALKGQGWLALSNGAVASAEGDLARIFDGSPKQWPRVKVAAVVEEGRMVTRATADFAEPPLGPLPEWKLPVKTAHGPFSQFAAVRGISGLAGRVDWWREAFAGQPPDQMFWWAQPEVPFRNWMTVPSRDPQGDLQRLYAAFSKVFGVPGGHAGRMAMASNHTAFAILDTLQGLQPVVSHVKQDTDQFLLGSLYPAAISTNPISAGLRKLLAEKDLVLQDAEFTPEALDHWNVLFQLNHMLQSHMPNARNARAHGWMYEIRGSLGDAETSVRQQTPTRLTLERKSSLGFTGIELVMLTRWLDGDDYLFRRMTPPPMPGTAPAPKKP